MTNPITLICPRSDYACTHVSVVAFADRLELFYGEKSGNGFQSFAHETVTFAEEPELAEVWDGIAWDIEKLVNLMKECCQ